MALDHRIVVKIITRGLVVLAGCLVLWKQWLTRVHATASVSSDRGVGVGFDLTESYGTASIRESSGTIVHVARIDGDETYRSTMERLSRATSRHMSPPYEWWHDGGALAGWDDIPRQQLRRLRKTFGQPASADVGAIAGLLSSLRSAVEDTQGSPVSHAVISVPDFAALYDEDIADAAAHVGLTLLSDSYFARQPRHVYAGFVAYGLNNKSTPCPPWKKWSDEHARNVLAVHLTHTTISAEATRKWTNRTCPVTWAQHRSYHSSRAERGTVYHFQPWQEHITALIQQCVMSEIQAYRGYYQTTDANITDIVLLGDGAAIVKLKQTIWNAVMEIQVQKAALHVAGEESVAFMASDGAAKMAWEVLNKPRPRENDDSGECYSEQLRKYDNSIRYLEKSIAQGLDGPENQLFGLFYSVKELKPKIR